VHFSAPLCLELAPLYLNHFSINLCVPPLYLITRPTCKEKSKGTRLDLAPLYLYDAPLYLNRVSSRLCLAPLYFIKISRCKEKGVSFSMTSFYIKFASRLRRSLYMGKHCSNCR